MKYDKASITRRYAAMKVLPSRISEVQKVAKRLTSYRSRYEKVQSRTGVPWWFVAVLHERESSADFDTYLGNGERLDHVTREVPEGRGPWLTFEDGAVDALEYEGFTKETDWSLEHALFLAEKFNGPGYANKGLPSPYVWGATNQQKLGKYTTDHGFDESVMDPQIGVAAMLQLISAIVGGLFPSATTPVTGAGTTVSPVTTITNALGMIIGAVLISRGVDAGTASTIGAGVVGLLASLLNQLHITSGANANTALLPSFQGSANANNSTPTATS